MFQFFCKIVIVTAIACSSFYFTSGSDFSKVFSNGKCLRPDGGRGICRNIKECEPLLNLLITSNSRPQPWVIDFLRRSHCGFEGKDPVVCCPIAVKQKDNDHESLNLTIKNPLYEKFVNKSCGSVQTLDKVIGGSETASHEFPWMALLGYKTISGLQFRCGGTLISHRYVLTAAHCVSTLTDSYPALVRLGEYDLEKTKNCEDGKGCTSPAKDIPIEELIPHPDYLKRELRNDIALIRLAENVEFQNYIRPICLPITKDFSERTLQSEKATVTGWGTTEFGTRTNVLRKITLPIIPLSECSKVYRKMVPITESQICAGGQPDKDSCRGDSGGPLQILGVNAFGEPAWIQHGIVSFGPKICGLKGNPGVYTKVAHYLEWILKNIKE